MTSAINVVLNLVCLWLLFIVMADLRTIRNALLLIGTMLTQYRSTTRFFPKPALTTAMTGTMAARKRQRFTHGVEQ